MNASDTKPGHWYVADGRIVVDHDGYTIAASSGKREAKQIVRDHNAVRDALVYLRSAHITTNLFRIGLLGRQDYEAGIKRLESVLTLQEREAQQ